jgi:PAS domain S-box-containing protein
MAAKQDDDQSLRLVALQNAQSILAARVRAEEALRTQSDWLQTTLESIGDAVISTDAEGRIAYLNRVAELLTGWSRSEAIGRVLPEVLRIVNEATREPVEDLAQRALRERVVVAMGENILLIDRHGVERPIEDSAAPIQRGADAALGVVVVFRDVSERRQAQQAQAFLAAIIESSDDAIVSKTLEGVIRTWNAGAERLFGYTAHEAEGKPITLIIPPDRYDEEGEILARLRRGERVDHFETVRVTKDGRHIDISLTISPIRDASGRIIGASKVARDITARKRAEEALRETDRRKDEFIALLAHELRNPLAPLRNGLQVMRIAPDDAIAVSQARGMMERQLNHMVRLIDDLLDISRINRNNMELRRERVLLAEVVRSAVETARPLIAEAGQTLKISLPPVDVCLDADLTRLAQVFGNLLTNSAKYTERGGNIWLEAERHGAEVLVRVKDTGIGIPAEAIPTIFDMFSQVGRSIERTTGGLGIGLALVKGLVEMHGGTVAVESAGLGKGCTFIVRLPALERDADAAHDGTHQVTGAGQGTKRRILVAEDNRDSAISMSMMLRLVGNDVRTAHDGIEAVAVAKAFRPDVILMDVGMPRLNGYDATRRIREQPWGKGITIIALTGWGQERDKVRSTESGCDGHIVKPVDFPTLERLLTDLKTGKSRVEMSRRD